MHGISTDAHLDDDTLALILTWSQIAMLLVRQDGSILHANELAAAFFGYRLSELAGLQIQQLIANGDIVTHFKPQKKVALAKTAVTRDFLGPFSVTTKDGTRKWINVAFTSVIRPNGPCVLASVIDLSPCMASDAELRETRERYDTLFNAMGDGIGVLQDGRFVVANRELATMVNYSLEEVKTVPFAEIVAPSYRGLLDFRSRERAQPSQEPENKSEVRLWCKGKQLGAWVEIHVKPIPFGGALASLVVLRDISERKRLEHRLEQIANEDELTGVPNRRGIMARLDHEIAAARRHRTIAAVLYFDLDGFKRVNDQFGHSMGDELLRQVVHRTRAALRSTDALGRLGGDEFLVILTDLVFPRDAEALATKLLIKLREPYLLQSVDAIISASIGVSFYPNDAKSSEELVRLADHAMFQIKRLGKNGIGTVSMLDSQLK